ncbi:CHRD domain-containing protein [Niastella sp. OAS944]|uniref:CHRD domain-containing protein n=1 Tax=Niastella sp. OAS944 TaxID=2664089 RepID=UPI003494E814|nr:hypothetical protein [Chitinophagaceae bacterium OAS944]
MKILTTIFILFSIAIACTKGGKPTGVNALVYSVNATASSKQLVPAIDTTSTATFTGLYDADANTLTYSIAWTDLWRDTKKDTITSISFYGPATATENGKLVRILPFVNTNRNGSINLGLAGNTGITTDEKNAFISGSWYFTINTKRYDAGIVRGQLMLTEK